MKKKREFQSSELVKLFAKRYGLEEQLLRAEIRTFLETYLEECHFQEIESISLKNTNLEIRFLSSILRNEYRMKKSFLLGKIQTKFGAELVNDLQIL